MSTDAKGNVPSSEKDKTSVTSTKVEAVAEPYSGQFWDDNPTMNKARKIFLRIMIQRVCLILVGMLGIFSIYWGALFHLPARDVTGWIVDFDGDAIGQRVTQDLLPMHGRGIRWELKSPSDFPNGPDDLPDNVLHERCWAAVIINPGATRQLNLAFSNNATNYNASSAITFIGNEARNENAYRTFIRPQTEQALENTFFDFAVEYISQRRSLGLIPDSIPSELLIRPVYYTLIDLRPYDRPVAAAVTFVGLIYLLIMAFIVVNSSIRARGLSGIERLLSTRSMILLRLVPPVIIYFLLSCMYSIVNLCFQLPFTRRFGHAGFVVFWMLVWFGLMAAGLALESMITLLTPNYVQFFLITWIISNVAVCSWPLEVLPKVYNYGHAAPFYQISRGVRAIIFETKNELGQNFGILATWIVISCCTLPLFQWWRHNQAKAAWKKSTQKGV